MQGGRGVGDKIIIPGFDILNHDVTAMAGDKVASVNFMGDEVCACVTSHNYVSHVKQGCSNRRPRLRPRRRNFHIVSFSVFPPLCFCNYLRIYGAKSNAHLLFQYGFSLHPNRFDWIELAIPIARDEEDEAVGAAR